VAEIPRLVPLSEVFPSTYNPRTADEARLELMRLSLEKLGFILPIVAARGGEIISGHQRHLVAGRLGFEKVPVLYCDAPEEADRKALNIVFNRATNDMKVGDRPANLTAELARRRVEAMAEKLPLRVCSDKAPHPDGCIEGMFRCLTPVMVPVEPLAKIARPNYNAYMRNMTRALVNRGILMPVVITEASRIVNGIGRVQYASEQGAKELPAVYVSEAEADFADAMLNLLSMDFDLENRYADLLRFNSFRRARSTRKTLGSGFVRRIYSGVYKDFDVTLPENIKAWRRAYGTNVVDFGAGHMTETEILRSIGVNVAAFEPYRLNEAGHIDRTESTELARAFLAEIAKGEPISSVFVSSVFNSIPFASDRKNVVAICAALCIPNGVFHGNAMSLRHENWSSVTGMEQFSARRQETATFALDYETGILLGEYMEKPKVQKYHSAKEFYTLIKTGFETVEVEHAGNTHFARGVKPFVKPEELRAALEFEFDLPYPDGTKLGLVREAIAAFQKRLDVRL
jgi:ParB-like nuclease family protein